MASLKDLRNRIDSVKSTRKITSAMKMVAGAKLRRAQEQAEAARPYAERMERMLSSLAASAKDKADALPLLAGTGSDNKVLIVVMTSDRGLCGGFNSSIARAVRRKVYKLQDEGKSVQLLCVGRKGRDMLRRDFRDLIVETIENVGRPALTFDEASAIRDKITRLFDEGAFDTCLLYYNHFQSAISQVVTEQQLIPFPVPEDADEGDATGGVQPVYTYEPEEDAILVELLPHNLSTQIFRALLESNASEQGARMTAMDNATRNAGDMIDSLTLVYNRTRQAQITKELIEIISGAEAL